MIAHDHDVRRLLDDLGAQALGQGHPWLRIRDEGPGQAGQTRRQRGDRILPHGKCDGGDHVQVGHHGLGHDPVQAGFD